MAEKEVLLWPSQSPDLSLIKYGGGIIRELSRIISELQIHKV